MPKPKEGYLDLPADFFNDLADENFINEVVDREAEDDPHLNRCIEEIKVLERKIEKKKQTIRERQDGLTIEVRRSRSRSRSRDRRHRDRERRKRSTSRSRSPHGSRHGRHEDRMRDRRMNNMDRSVSPLRGRPSRRSRSKSQTHRSKRSSSTHKNISFLEELAQKFAEKGQAFPEKDALLMGQNQIGNNAAIEPNVPMGFGNVLPYEQPIVQPPMISIPNFPQQVGFPTQGMFYGLNPMSIMGGNASMSPGNLAPFPGLGAPQDIPAIGGNPRNIPPGAQATAPRPITESGLSDNQRASIIDRCEHAIKLIRAKDNKVPIMKFRYNRTSLVVANSNELTINKSPLQVKQLNAPFNLNAPSNKPLKSVNGLKMLPKRVRDVAQSLGINSAFLFEKMRTKELNAQITDQIKLGAIESDTASTEILIQTNTVPLPMIETTEMGTQTNQIKCDKCVERNRRVMVSAHTQVFLKNCSIGTQTNEKDYREPIVELLSKMTAAQLVAIKDFTNIISEPRASNSLEYSRVRERLIDIYNLSQRDADTVRAAEENQMDDVPYIEPSRFRGEDGYAEGLSRDFNRRSNSPRFNGSMMERSNFGGNFESNNFSNDRNRDDRMPLQRGMPDDRFPRMDEPYQRQIRNDDQDREERERQIYLEMERRRELELEMNQRRYDEQMEMERMRAEKERRMNMPNFQPLPNHPLQFEDEMRQFNRDKEERETQRQNMFNSARGTMNRRGRGAFRDNFRGGRGTRR